MLSTDFLGDALVQQTQEMVAVARGAELHWHVPTCPDWDVRQLLSHVGRGHRFGIDLVRRQVAGPGELIDPASIAVPPLANELGEWLVDGARELAETVRSVGADQPVWNFTGDDQRAWFWLRRMVHDTVVHRCDAALTVPETCAIDAELAVDGISEWLTLVTSPGAAAARPEDAEQLRGNGQTLHLHATDSPEEGAGEWLIRRGPDAVTWQYAHQKADVAVRGHAGDLLLALLGRIPVTDERIAVFGEVGLFEHWIRHVTF